jgi:hypothetical protein
VDLGQVALNSGLFNATKVPPVKNSAATNAFTEIAHIQARDFKRFSRWGTLSVVAFDNTSLFRDHWSTTRPLGDINERVMTNAFNDSKCGHMSLKRPCQTSASDCQLSISGAKPRIMRGRPA